MLGSKELLAISPWPEYDEAKTVDSTVEIAIQLCGKMKGTVLVPADCDEDTAFKTIIDSGKLGDQLDGKTIVKKIYVKNRIFNIVAK